MQCKGKGKAKRKYRPLLRIKAMKLTARQVQDSVAWLLKENCGCCHFKVCDTKLWEVDAVIGWHKTEKDDPNSSRNTEVYVIAWKIGMQSFNNGMQCDMDIDFQLPWNEDGDCIGGETEICGEHDKGITFKAASAIAKDIRAEAKRIARIQKELERDNEGSGKAVREFASVW